MRGLTAAGLWLVAGLELAIGIGFYSGTIVGFLFSIFVLIILKKFIFMLYYEENMYIFAYGTYKFIFAKDTYLPQNPCAVCPHSAYRSVLLLPLESRSSTVSLFALKPMLNRLIRGISQV